MRSVLIVLCLFAATLAGPQASAPKADPTPGGTLSSRSELVLVPVVVTDRSGAHTPGLKPEDFVLTDNGKVQQVRVFEETKASEERHIAKATLQADEFSNVLQEQQSPKRLVIIALDTINTRLVDQPYARNQLINFLANNVDPNAALLVLKITRGGIKIVHDATVDPALLVAALNKVQGRKSNVSEPDRNQLQDALFATEVSQLEDLITGWNEDSQISQARANAEERRLLTLATIEAMRQIADAYAGIPGRKSLVWMTSGFPFVLDTPGTMDEVARHYERLWQRLNDANIAVYPVDVGGLVDPNPKAEFEIKRNLGTQSLSSPGDPRDPNYAPLKTLQANIAMGNMKRMTMTAFADMTGGRAFYGSNGLDSSLRKASQDAAAFYLLGFYLDKNPKPGWHKLNVKVSRAGVLTRARNGFFVRSAAASVEAERTNDITAALTSPLDFTGLLLRVRWTEVKNHAMSGKREVGFQITVPARAVGIEREGVKRVRLQFVGVARTPVGEIAATFNFKADTDIKTDSTSEPLPRTLSAPGNFVLGPGEYSVKMVVRDNLTGQVGSVQAPLVVR